MANLNWYLPLDRCKTLDEIRPQWHALLEAHAMTPQHNVPRYRDAVLAFAGQSTLSPHLKLAAVLAFGSAFDVDLRLVLGALAGAVMESEAPWPESVAGAVSDNGPALQVASTDDWLGAFVAGRLAGLRETFTHDGTRLEDWHAAFWNAFLEMAARHGAPDAVRLALRHGADPRAHDAPAVAARGMAAHARDDQTADAAWRVPTNAGYERVLLQLLDAGLPRAELLATALPAAAAADDTGMLDFLVTLGADVGVDGSAALAATARHLAFDAFDWLRARGVAANDADGAVLAGAAAALDETMIDMVLAAGADLRAHADAAILAALHAQPWDLYSIEKDFAGARADAVALLLRRGARPSAAVARRTLQALRGALDADSAALLAAPAGAPVA